MKKTVLLLLAICMFFSLFVGCTAQPATVELDLQEANESHAVQQTAEEEPAGVMHTITYDPNYDEVSDEIKEVEAGQAIPIDKAGRWGYSNTGWYLEPECTTAVEEGQAAAQDLTLYAGWEEWDKETMKTMETYREEMEYGKYISNRKTAYEEESFNAYYKAWFSLFLVVEANKNVVTAGTIDMLNNIKPLRESLVQVVDDPEDVCLYIWEGNMAVEEGMENKADYGYFDNEGFEPFLMSYLVEDQSKVKGNIIVIAGGGFFLRANYDEAYPAAEYFNEQGYNTFVLQRRVAPYSAIDSSLDLQRSVRYLRYYADELGIAKTENMIACGFSGGGGTTLGMVEKLYGDVLPTAIYTDYQPDEVDQINSDLSAMIIVYGTLRDFETNNPNVPPVFIVSSTGDYPEIMAGSYDLMDYVTKQGKNAELHIFAEAPHGFGMAEDYVGANQWGMLAELFLDVELGYSERKIQP